MAYIIFYLVTDIFMLYSWYLVIRGFSDKKKVPMMKLLIIGIAFNFVDFAVSEYTDLVLINLVVITALFGFYSFFMSSTLKKSLQVFFYSISTVTGLEFIVYMAQGSVVESIATQQESDSMIGRLLVIAVTMIVGLSINYFRKERHEIDVPQGYWLRLLLLPVTTFIVLFLTMPLSITNPIYDAAVILLLLVINVICFTIYQQLISLHRQRIDDLSMVYLNDSYKKQLEVMKAFVNNANSINHDVNRHLISVEALIDTEKYEEASHYLNELKDEFNIDEILAKSGNTIIDSIINFEYDYAGIDKNRVKLDISQIPSEIKLSNYELTIVLSNLIRNAFQAIKSCEDGVVDIKIEYQKGLFFIRILNDYEGILNEVDGQLMTLKKSAENKGLGLANVRKVVEAYEGDMEITAEKDKFGVEVLIYI